MADQGEIQTQELTRRVADFIGLPKEQIELIEQGGNVELIFLDGSETLVNATRCAMSFVSKAITVSFKGTGNYTDREFVGMPVNALETLLPRMILHGCSLNDLAAQFPATGRGLDGK